jgi:hypothetical protein
MLPISSQAPISNYASIILLRMAYRTRAAVEWIFSLRWTAPRCVSQQGASALDRAQSRSAEGADCARQITRP